MDRIAARKQKWRRFVFISAIVDVTGEYLLRGFLSTNSSSGWIFKWLDRDAPCPPAVLSASFLVISNLYTTLNSRTSAANESSFKQPGSGNLKVISFTGFNEAGRTEKWCLGFNTFHPGEHGNR